MIRHESTYRATVTVAKPSDITVFGPSLDQPGQIVILASSYVSMKDAEVALRQFCEAVAREAGAS